jgi:hypothetical protein
MLLYHGRLAGSRKQLGLRWPETANCVVVLVCYPAPFARLVKIVLPIIGGLVLCFAMISLICTHVQCRKRRPRTAYTELAKATDVFAKANLISAGKYGSVYQGIVSLTTEEFCP